MSLLFFLFTALISLTRSHEQRLTPDFFLVSVVRRDSISFLFVLLSSPSILAADQSTKKKSARRRGQTNKREKENGESDSESRESRARVPLSLIDLALGALSVAVRSVSFSLSLFFSSSSILLSARREKNKRKAGRRIDRRKEEEKRLERERPLVCLWAGPVERTKNNQARPTRPDRQTLTLLADECFSFADAQRLVLSSFVYRPALSLAFNRLDGR